MLSLDVALEVVVPHLLAAYMTVGHCMMAMAAVCFFELNFILMVHLYN